MWFGIRVLFHKIFSGIHIHFKGHFGHHCSASKFWNLIAENQCKKTNKMRIIFNLLWAMKRQLQQLIFHFTLLKQTYCWNRFKKYIKKSLHWTTVLKLISFKNTLFPSLWCCKTGNDGIFQSDVRAITSATLVLHTKKKKAVVFWESSKSEQQFQWDD